MIGTWDYGHVDARTITARMLFTRIVETIGWCRRVLQSDRLRPSLRTEEIRPRLLSDGIDQMVCDLGLHRARLIDPKVTETDKLTDMFGGRFLIYFPDADLADGAAASESEGFFDEHNIPPWDTWISFFDDKSGRRQSYWDDKVAGRHSYYRYLLAYVPRELANCAARGIIVNPEQCIVWLDEATVALRDRIAASKGRTKR